VNVLEEVGPTNFVLVKKECQLDPILRLVVEGISHFTCFGSIYSPLAKQWREKKQGHLLTNIMGRDLTLPHDLLFQCKDTLRHGLAVVCPSTIQSCHITLSYKPQHPRYLVTSGGTNHSVGR
jgi:hypothetical protein